MRPIWAGGKVPLLEVKNLSVNYGMVSALTDVSFHVEEGEIVAMVGPNGAGKSTALNAVSGLLEAYDGKISKGQILYEDESIDGIKTHQLVKRGISLVPEGRRVFPGMTVLENMEMGAFTRPDKAAINTAIEYVLTLFPQLKERLKQKAGTLSTGEQQMLAMGRALMLKPKLLLADEPSLGLSPNYVDLIFDKLVAISKAGTSILLVEQNARMALEVCHRGYVFDIGTIALDGPRKELLGDPKLKSIFLGG